MPKKVQRPNEQDVIDYHYSVALSRLDSIVKTMLLQAMDCHAAMDNPIALAVYSELYQFSAKNMARAVELHPEYFPDPTITPPEQWPRPDAIVSLRIIAQLNNKKEPVFFKKWKEMNWPTWKVFEEVQALNRRQPYHSKQKAVIKRAKVIAQEHQLIVMPRSEFKPNGLNGEFEVRLYRPTEEEKE